MNRQELGLVGILALEVREQPTQAAANQAAANLWRSVAVSDPRDAQHARKVLTDAAAQWGQERAS